MHFFEDSPLPLEQLLSCFLTALPSTSEWLRPQSDQIHFWDFSSLRLITSSSANINLYMTSGVLGLTHGSSSNKVLKLEHEGNSFLFYSAPRALHL